MARLPAFAVDGALATGRLLRTVAYAATSGQTGIVTPDSMKVTASGAGVSIAAGAAVAATRYVSSPAFNSYVVTADSGESLAIPATGSGGGATRYIIARVDDPEYGGQGDPTKVFWRYDQVASITALAYPFVPLARINQPASTTTITDAMITDLREIATPRTKRYTETVNVTIPANLTSSTYVRFPHENLLEVDVPEWATKLIVRADIVETLHSVGNVDGWMVLRLGGADGEMDSDARRYDEVWSGSDARRDHTIIGTLDVPASARGGMRGLQVRGRRVAGSGYLRCDAYTQVLYDIQFLEAPA